MNTKSMPEKPANWSEKQWDDYIFMCMNDIPKAEKEAWLINEPGDKAIEELIEALEKERSYDSTKFPREL